MKTNPVVGVARLFGRALAASALAAALLSGSSLAFGQNTTVVNFGGDYTSASNVFLRGTSPAAVTSDVDGDGTADDSSVAYAFSTTTPLSPTANYTGPLFYGGARGAVLNQTGLQFGERQIVNNATTDALGIRYQPNTGLSGQFHAAIYFDKAQFLNGASNATAVRFTTGSSLALNTPRFENLGTVRWLVRNGTQFYVSAATVASNGSLTIASATDDGQWAPYDPATALNFDAAAATFTTQDFQNITAVGLLVDKDAYSAVRHWLQIRTFTASLQVITGLPTAAITATPASGAVPLAVSFNGSASTAPAGATLTNYAWNFGDGGTATGATASRTYTAPGSYTATLTVTDSFGQTDSETVAINVTNSAPTASFTATPTSGNAPLAVAFNGAGSSDPENHTLTYAWDFGDGTTGTGVAPNKTYNAAGTYTVSLVVTDAYGAASTAATGTITALNANVAPTASFTVTPTTGAIPLAVSVNGSASSDPDGSIASYAWNFGDGSTATGATASYTYTTAGTFTITLTVTDNQGATASTTRTVGATDGTSAVIVNFSGDLVTASTNFRNGNPTTTAADLDADGTADDSFSQYAFSTTTALSPTTGYTGPRFFGGVRGETLNNTTTALGERSIVNNATTDAFGVRHQPAAGISARLFLVFYVDKADFLAGGATTPVKFDYLSRFRMTNPRFENLGEVRWLVRDGTQFYVSETLASSGGTLTFANNNDDGRWAPFDPAASLNFDAGGAAFTTRNFTNVTGVGLITDKDSFSAVRHWLQFSLFEVTAFVGNGNGTANLPPTAAFTATPNPVKRPNAVAFNSSASSDPESGTLTRAWAFGDGNTSTATNPSYVYAAPGTYTASLTVTDPFGNTSAPVTRVVTVLPPNVAPTASVSATPTQGEAPLAVSFSGSASSDSDGSITSYAWNFGDGTTATGATASKTYTVGGEYTAALTVTDNDGATHTQTVVIRALVNGNVPPTASFTATPTNGLAPLAVALDAAASSDPDGTIASYAWDFGDGTNATGVTASKTYTVPGTYTITLLVTDNSGGVRTATRNLLVIDPANAGPTDNPVATKYGATAYPWTDQINWTNVFNVTTFAGATDMERYIAARDAAVAAGGGVVYFPAGTYTFTEDLYLANGVVIRGATPTNTDAKSATYDPPTKFVFPQYIPSFTGSGTPTSTAFKQIFTTTGNTDSNLGLVYIDVNRARINLQGDKDLGTNRNYLIFGVRSNNVALADGSIPKTTYQNAWQVWPNRFATNISITVFENTLIANNRLNDAITDDFEMPGYIVEDTSKPVGDPARFVTLTGPQAKFEYAAHYGIYVNRGSSVTYGTPATAPSLFRTGIVIRDNYVYGTNRVKIHAAGLGLVIQDNVLRDDPNKARWIAPTGDKLVQNAATLENRGIDFSGHQIQIVGNDVQVARHRLKEGPYYSVDGEGILHQECCGGSSIRGVLIEDNIVNSYIGLYKSREIEDAVIRGNLVTNGTGALTDLIYVVADTNSTPYYVKNVVIENNTIQSGNNIRLEGDGAGGGTGNVIQNNTSTGSGTINVSNAANATTSNNTGFTVVPF
jgi:PKD repeat protein